MSDDPGKVGYWEARWEEGRTGFHRPAVNEHLLRHEGHLPGQRVLVPFAGKSIDCVHLRDAGRHVVAIEASRLAAEQFHVEHGLTPEITTHGTVERWATPGIEFLLGDLFGVENELIGQVDAIWDRAALIALPEADRAAYSAHLTRIAPQANHLLVTMEYDQDLMAGPPFSVDSEEVRAVHARGREAIDLGTLDITDEGPKFRNHGLERVQERVWLLRGNAT